MKFPSKTQFRFFAITGFALLLAGHFIDHFGIPAPSPEEAKALEWNYWGSVLPYSIQRIIWCIGLVAWISGMLGFITFQPWSRGVLLGVMIISVITSPLMGLYVARGLSEGVGTAGSFLFFFPFVLSFFPPVQ